MTTDAEQHQPVTIERLERGLALASYLVVRDGDVMVPMFEKLGRELEAMRSGQDAAGHARRLLESIRRGATNASGKGRVPVRRC